MASPNEYSPGRVWSVLRGESEDLDELLDVDAALGRLSVAERTFIKLLMQGWPASYAMKLSGLAGNQTRVKDRILNDLTRLINEGGSHDNTDDRADQQRAALRQDDAG